MSARSNVAEGLPSTMQAEEHRYLFLHVPKTAGSAMRAIVKQNLGKTAAAENPLLSTQIYTAEQIDWLFAAYPYRVYSGHVFRLRPALAAGDGELKLIAFVRDPVDKAISSYYYLRNRELTRADHPAKTRSFATLCTGAIRGAATDSNGFDDSQLDWLVGERDAKLDVVEDAVASGQLLLFPTEGFDLAMVLLERLFPDDFRDCSYARLVNASSYDKGRDVESERAAAASLPWITSDRLLHRLAAAQLDVKTATFFRNDAEKSCALAEFRERCKSRSQCLRQRSVSHSLWQCIKAPFPIWSK